MDSLRKEELIQNMTDNLPVLRKCLGLSQEEFSSMVGVSRSTLAAIENHKHQMSWNMFLALMLFFTKHQETDRLLDAMEIYTDDFNKFIKEI